MWPISSSEIGDIAIDATVGNGHDTVFLVEQVSPSGKVYGFDIQQAAIDSTRVKIQSRRRAGEKAHSNVLLRPECLILIHASHADMAEKIPAHLQGKINVCMFNLGYLPGSDKSIITRTESTITALAIASRMLSSTGILTILAYPGHHGGDQEAIAVKNWCEQLDEEQFSVSISYSTENKVSAPRLYVVDKLRGVAIFAKAFLGIPAQQAAKITRPLMPSAAPAVLVTRSLPNKGIAHMLSNDSTRFRKACIFTTLKLRENTCPIASGDYSTPVSQRL